MVCNGLCFYVFVTTDCDNTRRCAPRLARRTNIIVYDCTFNFIYLMYLNSNYDTDFIMLCNKKV